MEQTNQAAGSIMTKEPESSGTVLVIPGATELVANAPSQRQLRIQANKLAIVQAMVTAGIAQAIVSYDGAGDDGSIKDISIEGGQILAEEVKVQMVQEKGNWNAEKKLWEYDTELVTETLTDALKSFVDDLSEEYHGGYENGDGGGGTATIISGTGSVEYEKFDYIVERACETLDI